MEHKIHKLKLITASLTAAVLTISLIVFLEVMRTGTNALV